MAKYNLLKFTTNTKTYLQSGAIERNENVLGYHFINIGGAPVFINNLPLYPSNVLDTMYAGYQDTCTYNIRFDLTLSADAQLLVMTYEQA